MSREILFRAWHAEAEKFTYSTDDFNDDYIWVFESSGIEVMVYDEVHTVQGGEDIPRLEVTESIKIIDQFTGLTDKNRVKIFEGDLIGFGANQFNFKGKIVFEKGAFLIQWITDQVIRQRGSYEMIWANSELVLAVIGNVHQNPELL